MGKPEEPEAGSILELAKRYRRDWFLWRNRWNGMYYIGGSGVGITSAVTAGAAGRNNKWAVYWACAAAALAFIVTVTNAGKRGRAFERAARKVERALAPFHGSSESWPDESTLVAAINAGLDELDKSDA